MEQLHKESTQQAQVPQSGPTVPSVPSVERRMFLRAMGLFTASTAAFLAACQNSVTELTPDGRHSGARVSAAGDIDLGSGDFAVLNYAYALEQLETAFYMTAVDKAYSGIKMDEKQVLMDIHDHELVHREFFKAALGPNAIPQLEFDFSSIDFSNRQEVLNTARIFEDLGVAAYNGAGKLLTNATFLTLAGKIVSVEARHASLISILLSPGSELFAGDYVVDNNGLDRAYSPAQVLPAAQRYIKQRITANNFPTM